MPRNKDRLYLAFWNLKPSPGSTETHHVGLLLIPKNPADDQRPSAIFHVITTLGENTDETCWMYEARITESRTNLLSGVMLLGKVLPEVTAKDIKEILQSVSIPAAGEWEETGWNCTNWTRDAMALLVRNNVIELKGTETVQGLYEIALDFVERTTDAEGFSEHAQNLPTCDRAGKEIQSEIGPLR